MELDIEPSGASIRQRVLSQPTAPGDPFLAPFFETAIEHVWGGLWNRPGLGVTDPSLGGLSVLAATGVHTAALNTHLHGALNPRRTRERLPARPPQSLAYAAFYRPPTT